MRTKINHGCNFWETLNAERKEKFVRDTCSQNNLCSSSFYFCTSYKFTFTFHLWPDIFLTNLNENWLLFNCMSTSNKRGKYLYMKKIKTKTKSFDDYFRPSRYVWMGIERIEWMYFSEKTCQKLLINGKW